MTAKTIGQILCSAKLWRMNLTLIPLLIGTAIALVLGLLGELLKLIGGFLVLFSDLAHGCNVRMEKWSR